MPKQFVTVCFINFFLAALLGLVLRYANFEGLRFNYKYFTHAHSHVAMLGWVYLILYTLIVHYFIPDKKDYLYSLVVKHFDATFFEILHL